MVKPANYRPIPPISSPSMFAERLDASLLYLHDQALLRSAGVKGEATVSQISLLLTHLFMIRDSVVGQRLPSIAERHARSMGWILNECWDPWDYDGGLVYSVIVYYLDNLNIPPHFPDQFLNPNLITARTLAGELARQRARDEQAKLTAPPAEHPDVLTMPHNPDKGSVDVARAFAQESLPEKTKQVASARERRDARFFWDLSQQWLIAGLTDYWYKRPLADVARNLREGLIHVSEALMLGYPAHAWDIFHSFLKAEAVNDQRLAGQIIALAEGAWNTDQIKPVYWLVLQIRCCFALHRNSDRALDPLLADLHQALFIDQLPPELDRDLPLMHNFWRLLRALRLRDSMAFNVELAERAAILSASYRQGGGIAPTALCDMNGLGLCRFAKQRGIVLTVQHIYLPLGILDQTL